MCPFCIEISLATKLLDLSKIHNIGNFIYYITYNTALRNDNLNKKKINDLTFYIYTV